MALISYNISLTPPALGVQLGLGVTPQALTIKLDSVDDFSLSVQPSPGTIVAGAVAGSILALFTGPAGALLGGSAGVATVQAIGELIRSQLATALKTKLVGMQQTLKLTHDGQPLGYSVQVAGVDVRVEAETLSLSTHGDMLMATGTLKVR